MNLPIIYLSLIYDDSTMGLIWYSFILLQIPTAILGSAVGNIFTVTFAQFKNPKDYLEEYKRNIFWLIHIGVTIFSIAIISTWILHKYTHFDDIFPIVSYLYILVPLYLLQFIVSPLSLILYKFSSIRNIILLQVVGIILRVGFFDIYKLLSLNPIETLSYLGQCYYLLYFFLIQFIVTGSVFANKYVVIILIVSTIFLNGLAKIL